MTIVGLELDGEAREILRRSLRVVDLLAHHLAEALHVRRARPLERCDVSCDAHGLHGAQRLARLGEEVPHDERRVAHHVVEHAAALQVSLPEPGHVRARMLLRGAREERPARRRSTARPQQLAARFHMRRKELVLEVARLQPDTLHEPRDLLCLGDVPRERLLAGDALERALAGLDRVDDLLDVLDARLIRAAEPERVDARVGDHRGDALVRLRLADLEIPCQTRRARGVLRVWAPDAEYVGVADALPGLDVEAGVETGTNEADAETGGGHGHRNSRRVGRWPALAPSTDFIA